MSVDLETIRRLVAQCDPQVPLQGGDPRYIPLDTDPPVRGEQACIDLMRRTILHAEKNESCQLFTGFPGTGKTTELLRLKAKFEESQAPTGGYVVYINFEEFIQLYEAVSLSDVLRVLAFCLAREADRVSKTADGTEGEAYLRAFFKSMKDALPKSAELKSVDFELFGAKLMLELRNNPAIHEQVERAIRSRFQHFADECRDWIGRSIKRIQAAVGGRAERFVVIADGLEKLSALHENDREAVENSAESLFVLHGEFLHLPCHVIYTFPVWLRFRTAQLGSVYDCEPLTLPMIKVHDRGNVGYEPGLQKLYQMLERRLGDPARIFGPAPQAALLPILEASGGYPRDALRLVRTLLTREESFPVSAAAVQREIRALQRSYHDAVLGDYAELLNHIDRTHLLPNQNPAQLRLFGQLFARFLVLAYRNGEEWFDLHPLVRKAPALLQRFGEAAP
ncbi:MAG: hypothetical protein JNK56_00895 [Myxococcales bacterium]|nr:hypothetical protein [Myxococcales bacterium]